MENKIKAVLFDFDDTIIQTKDIAFLLDNIIARSLPGKKISREEFKKHYGMPLEKIHHNYWPQAKKEEIQLLQQRTSFELNFNLIPGTIQTLKELKELNLIMGIISNSKKERIEKKLKEKNLTEYFEVIEGTKEKIFKPNPKIIENSLNKLKEKGIKKEEVLFVGDNLIDYFTALNTGIKFIAVLTGLHERQEFLKNGLEEKLIINSIKELTEKLKELNEVNN